MSSEKNKSEEGLRHLDGIVHLPAPLFGDGFKALLWMAGILLLLLSPLSV